MITAAFPRPLVRHVAGLSGEVPRGDACGDNTTLCAAIKAAPASPNVAVDRGPEEAGGIHLLEEGCCILLVTQQRMFDLPPVAIGKMMHKYNQDSTVIHIARPSQL